MILKNSYMILHVSIVPPCLAEFAGEVSHVCWRSCAVSRYFKYTLRMVLEVSAFGIFWVQYSPNSVDTCGHTEGFLREGPGRGVQSKWYPWRPAFSLQISTQNGSCERSMCISTAKARRKRWPRDSSTTFSS